MKRTAPLLLALLLLCLVGCARPSAGAFALYQQAYEKLAASRSYEMDITMSLAGRAGAEEMQLGMDLRICQAQRSGHTLPDTAANLTLRITGLSITVDVYAREDSIYVAALGQKMRMNVEEALAAAGGADASTPSGDEPPSFLPLSNEYVTDGSVLANGMGRRVFFQIDSEAFLAAQML
ncbi:hypothetical protein LJC04_05970, partial [Ruminococcaceae bacterium OttesenSCG-928-O06]|nr:hypothetical protein [Ruminococcaceae bacterium OttesenSCG-928-O06]